MITSIQLQITPGASLPASTLEKLIERAKQRGISPDDLLAELITAEVENHFPPVKPRSGNGKAKAA